MTPEKPPSLPQSTIEAIEKLTPFVKLGWYACFIFVVLYAIPDTREFIASFFFSFEDLYAAVATEDGNYFDRYGVESYKDLYVFTNFAIQFLVFEFFAALLIVGIKYRSMTPKVWASRYTWIFLVVCAIAIVFLLAPAQVCESVISYRQCHWSVKPWVGVWLSAIGSTVLLPLLPAVLFSSITSSAPSRDRLQS